MSDPLDELFDMIQNLVDRVEGTPWADPEELNTIKKIINDYRNYQGEAPPVEIMSLMREDIYKIYKVHYDNAKTMKKYTPEWELERKMRDMYFKFLNVPILFMIGTRDQTFDIKHKIEEP